MNNLAGKSQSIDMSQICENFEFDYSQLIEAALRESLYDKNIEYAKKKLGSKSVRKKFPAQFEKYFFDLVHQDNHRESIFLEEIPNKEEKNIQGMLQRKSNNWQAGFFDQTCRLQNNVFSFRNTKLQMCYLYFDLMAIDFETKIDKNGIIQYFQYLRKLQLLQRFRTRDCRKEKTFVFRAQVQELLIIWVNAIKSSLLQSQGYKQQLKHLESYYRFWNNQIESNQKFINDSQNGDIIIFRGKNLNSKLQRRLTGSKYDHVGVVYKVSGHLLVLEASSNKGVGLFNWKHMIDEGWHEFFEKVVYRKLNTLRDQSFQETFKKFLNCNLGKKYGINIGKLIMRQSYYQDNQSDRTFFCSELIAKLYKELGLLCPQRPSASYYPAEFSSESKNSLNLLKQSNLSGDILIDFQQSK